MDEGPVKKSGEIAPDDHSACHMASPTATDTLPRMAASCRW